MKLTEGEVLDDALELFHNHTWVAYKPEISPEQLAELIPVLAPLFQQARPKAQARKKLVAAKPRLAPGTVTSSKVPARIREAALCRDGRCCQRCGVSLYGRDYSLQHRDARGMGGSKLKHTLANLVALCGTATTGCHGHVESERTESVRDGWSVPNGVTPEEWPVLRFGKSWELPGSGWVKAEPHPYQIEMGAVA